MNDGQTKNHETANVEQFFWKEHVEDGREFALATFLCGQSEFKNAIRSAFSPGVNPILKCIS